MNYELRPRVARVESNIFFCSAGSLLTRAVKSGRGAPKHWRRHAKTRAACRQRQCPMPPEATSTAACITQHRQLTHV